MSVSRQLEALDASGISHEPPESSDGWRPYLLPYSEEFAYAMDEVFLDLSPELMLYEKSEAYERLWKRAIRDRLLAENDVGYEGFERLRRNMILALANTHCTVEIRTSRGDGATIKYVKSIDAGRIPSWLATSSPSFLILSL